METKPPPITIRAAQENDISTMANLCAQLGYPTSENTFAQRLHDLSGHSAYTILVALNAQGQVIGWVHAYLRWLLVVDPHIELGGLVVDETHRGLGIGEKLMDAVEIWAQNLGIQTIFVRSNILRKDAHRFYEHLGYQLTKTSGTFQKRLAP